MNAGKSEGVPYDYDRIWSEVYGDIQRYGPVHRHSGRILGQFLAGLDYQSVFDVGCGPGHNHSVLSKGRPRIQYDGVDVSGDALALAREHVPDGHFWQDDIQQTHPDGVWDLVYCTFVLEHLPDDLNALRNMRAVTDRHLLLATIAGTHFQRYRSWEERVGHVRNYAPGELESRVTEAGFEVVRSMYWGFPFYSPVIRTMQRRGQEGLGSYSLGMRAIAQALYGLYFLNSSTKGDVVFVLAKPA